MEELARLEARIASLDELKDLFAAMRALAASHMQAAQSALKSIRSYAHVIEEAIADAAALQKPAAFSGTAGETPMGSVIIIVGSEQGFAGAFNRRLLERVGQEAEPSEQIVIVGRRCASVAGEFAISPAWTMPMATHLDGLLVSARRIAARLAERDSVRAIFGKYRGGSRFDVEARQILPLPPSAFAVRRRRAAPLHQLPAEVLLRRLIGEILLAEIMLVLTESFASENSARLQIMQAADHNIGEKLENLRRRSRQQKQEAITSELLEVVAGGEAVAHRSDGLA
jgi:F-type H+-transporting ATPase subunit gamma